MKIAEVRRKIENCVYNLYLYDCDLLERGNHELTISLKLAQYLFCEFKEFDVDCEYNKHIDNAKYSEELMHNVRPDIVIHKRGFDYKNTVYMEIKTSQNSENREYDLRKVFAMTKNDGDFKYKLGVFIDFTKKKKDCIIKYFKDGGEIEGCVLQ